VPDASFLNFVVELVKLGGLGIGALIFVLVFIILFRNQPADAATARLRSQFLIWGGSFALIALIVSTATSLLRPAEAAPAKFRLGITLSPDFSEAKLPNPEFRLMPSGVKVQEGQPIEIGADSTLDIKVRGIVSSVQALSKSSENLLQTNQQLTQAVEAAIKPASAGTSAAPPITLPQIQELKNSQEETHKKIIAGDFNAAAISSLKTRNFARSAIRLKP